MTAETVEQGSLAPRITDPGPQPPDVQPSASITPPSGRVVAGIQTHLTVNASRGAHYTLSVSGGQTVWVPGPLVTYSETDVNYDSTAVRDHSGGGGTYTVTFAAAGDHGVTASCVTTAGQVVTAAPVTVHVVAAIPPAFTIQAPAAGAPIPLSENGADVVVRLALPVGPNSHVTVTGDGPAVTGSATSGTFQATVHLNPLPLGSRVITVSVADDDGVAGTKTVTVSAQDTAPPHPVIVFPQPGTQAIADKGTTKATVPMNGKVTDSQSGMIGGSVSWALSPTGPRTVAQALTGTDFGAWQADVPLSGFGAHTIFLWATDLAGNTTPSPLTVAVEVISGFTPRTFEERLDEREYLTALLAFAHDQIAVAPGTPPVPLDTSTLIGVLGQPLDSLSQPLSDTSDRGGQEINQLRVPVELLRARILSTHAATTPGAAAEAGYRSTAYTSLLAAAGTSYAELRLARAAPPGVRQALAARLGIALSPARPDELDRLVMDGATLTEPALETVFGLPDTTGTDVLRVPPTPLLLTWRLAALVQTWAEQDQHPDPPRAFTALVDPDVISAADVAATPNTAPVLALLTARTTQLDTLVASFTTIRATGLAALLKAALPGVDLDALEAQDNRGVDIGPALATAGLTRTGFAYLREMGRLVAASQTLTTAEWNDTISVLVRARKQGLFTIWRGQETGLVLSPDFFVLSGDAGPVVSSLRADPRARTDWQSVLRSRIAQRQDVVDAVGQAVAEAEQAALPVLRGALLSDLGPADPDIGEQMSALLLVDVLAGGSLRTTRIRQAVESVQALLSALRSGELPGTHPAAGWKPADIAAFTAAWFWVGEYGSWQAATTAFLFPERQLDPTLLTPVASPAAGKPAPFGVLLDSARGAGDFNAAAANSLAAAYLAGMAQTFSYLDPKQYRSPKHQTDLRLLSGALTDAARNRETFWAVPMLLAQRLQAAGDFPAALDWYWLLYPYDLAGPAANSVYSVVAAEKASSPNLTFPPNWTALLDPFTLAANRPFAFSRSTLLAIIRCHLDFADAEYTRETDESVANARLLYLTALRLLGAPSLVPQPPSNQGEPTLPLPELDTLRTRARVQLAKLRQGRNIAGTPRTGQGLVTGVTISQPTPFRFRVLMERTRQLVAQAAQMEAGYLSALEKYDDRNLRLFDALKAIDLNAAQVSVAGSRVKEANDAVAAARAQQTKADVLASNFATLVAAPPNRYESDLLTEYGQMRDVRDDVVSEDMAITIAQAAAHGSNLFNEIVSFGAAGVSDLAIAAAAALKFRSQERQNELDAQMQANQLRAGIEQRRTEWRTQQISAQQDSLVAAAQVTTARDQVSIAVQEQAIASLQYDQAVATLKFLDGQFTNADLYLWMSNTLGGVYRYFLQQATATARLAQAQLGFERAEAARNLIRNDYWQSPAELTANGSATNRRGLTGAEQLSQDLSRLDEYALSSERRRLNLAQTFSLARLMPVEFLDFRRTGTLAFGTPMPLFDDDFPGHYLRMIRQVRTSVVALVPPDRGIRATLYSNGVSRVTTGQDGSFTDIVLRHDPTAVALTSPVNATGVFELDVQSDLLLPFESSGVDTTWELQLPPAANPFDYSSIVDVLVTIEYTALSDANYRDQLVARLNANRDRGADCVFSLARDFPDQWYDLNNPAGPGHRQVVLPLRDVDFPLGIDGLATSALAVRLVSGQPVPDTVITVSQGGAGGDATATGGIASTRRGNAAAWVGLIGRTPTGDWQITVGPGADPLFRAGQVDDLLLVVGWTGRSPAWT